MGISKVYVIWLLMLLFSVSVSAQSMEGNQSIEVSTKSLRKANDQLQKELSKLERRLKRKLSKTHVTGLDSLAGRDLEVRKEALKTQAKDTVNNYLRILKEEVRNKLKKTPENLPIAEEVKETLKQIQELEDLRAAFKDPEQLKQMLGIKELNGLEKSAGGLRSSLDGYKNEFEGWDQKLLDQVVTMPEAKLLKEKLDRAKSFKPLPESMMNPEQFQSNDFVREKLEAKADKLKKAGAASLQEKLDAAQAKVMDAKKKFPSLPSLEDAPKRHNANQGKRFLKRLILGGNLQVNQQKPLSVNAALSLTYPLSEKIDIGVSAATRIFIEKRQNPQVDQEQFSIRSFGRYDLWKHFYLQANYEFTKITTRNALETVNPQRWLRNALVGIGKQTQLSPKVKMNITALYDFLYKAQTSPYTQPWVMRVGFDLGKR